MEARSVSKGYYEETVTDSSGSFRLRGLVPETTYAIKVVKKDGLGTTRIERASPESVTIQVMPFGFLCFLFPFFCEKRKKNLRFILGS